MEKTKLLQYLRVVRDLEGIVYVHEEAINSLNREYQTISKRRKNNRYEKLREHTYNQYDIAPMNEKECNQTGIAAAITAGILLGVGSIFFGIPLAIITGYGGWIGIAFVVSIIISIAIGAYTAIDCKESYSFGSTKWREIEKQNEEIKKENDKQRRRDDCQIRLIPQEITLLKKNLSKAQSLLWDYYAVGTLHEDYRNMVAVCSIYQYLDSGRCTELTGKDGAYNLYEDEKIKYAFLTKLDEISRKLDQIQRTQIQLYNLMSECQSEISHLVYATERMSTSLNSIKESSRIIEYNTTYLKQTEEYRVLLNGY